MVAAIITGAFSFAAGGLSSTNAPPASPIAEAAREAPQPVNAVCDHVFELAEDSAPNPNFDADANKAVAEAVVSGINKCVGLVDKRNDRVLQTTSTKGQK